MQEICIIKLGGSVITDKKAGRPLFLARRAKEIAVEIQRIRAKRPHVRILLLYGGGSFGHPLAHKYRLAGRALSIPALLGVGYTVSAMRDLGTRLATTLLDADIPVVPLQTSSIARSTRDAIRFTDVSVLEDILHDGGVPLLGGDVVFSAQRTCIIASADALAVELARTYGAPLFFASDVDGVYATFPPRRGEAPLPTLTRKELIAFLKTQSVTTKSTDVTGAMAGKLRALLAAHGVTATICNGTTPGALASAVLESGTHPCTCIQL